MRSQPTTVAASEIWLYSRNSTDEQKQEATILSQKDAVHQDAATKGESISRVYTAEGRSGFTLIRPALDQLREDGRKPGCRCRVIRIYDKSRLARRAVLRHIVEDELEALGIRIEYIAAPIFDDTPEGQFAESVTDQLDEYMAAKIKQNLARGLDYHLRDGHVWWHPYGYRLDVVPGQKYPRVVIDEELRPMVREIFLRIIAGESAGLIARDLNRRGIPSPSVARARAQGKPDPQPGQWCDRTICAMIRNPYYVGHAAYDRTERCLPAAPTKRYRNKEKSSWQRKGPEEWYTADVPAIVSDEEQAAALAALASGRQRSPRNSKSQYLLRGLLRCPA
jgi:site-specific DNA recombinase